MSKGFVALLAMLGVLQLLHEDLHRFAFEWLLRFRIDPAGRVSHGLLAAADDLQTIPQMALIALGSLYSFTRFVEAWGLWHCRPWGEWLGALSGGVYVPFEVLHLARHPSLAGALIVLFNLSLVGYLAARIRRRIAQRPS